MQPSGRMLYGGVGGRGLPRETEEKAPLVSLSEIWKFFGGVPVLKGVNLDLGVGEIHALLGGNGSGKSTLMKILSGVYQKDRGSLRVAGKELFLSDPQAAHEEGIYLVPQEPKVFPNMSVLDNILCGLKDLGSEVAERAAVYAADLGFEGSLLEAASSLSIANQQLLEIIRGLVRDARVLVLDEPTSTLTFKEVSSLFSRMRLLAAKGIGIYFISHRLNEVFEIADRVSVLCDGVIVLSKPKRELSAQELIRAMLPQSEANGAEPDTPASVGSPVEGGALPIAAKGGGAEVFRVEGLSGFGFSEVSFSVAEGEVLGLAGVVGAGRTELAHAILGLDPFATGRVFMGGAELPRRSPARCLKQGIGYVPEDRHLHGIFLDLPNLYTMSSGVLERLGRPFVSVRRERALGERYIENLKIKVTSWAQRSGTLSGGNQQKVVLAKILASDPRLVILDEPTRGVDARARQDVYALIRELGSRGISVILISSDLPEVIQESDRILVMHSGRITAEFSKEEFDLEKITASSFGIAGEPAKAVAGGVE